MKSPMADDQCWSVGTGGFISGRVSLGELPTLDIVQRDLYLHAESVVRFPGSVRRGPRPRLGLWNHSSIVSMFFLLASVNRKGAPGLWQGYRRNLCPLH